MDMLTLRLRLRQRRAELEGRLGEAKAAGLTGLKDEVLARMSEVDFVFAELPETSPAPAPEPAPPKNPPRRPATKLSELIDPRVMEVLVRDGAISPKDIRSILGVKLLGPVMSGWKRRCTLLGADLDVLLVKDKAESGENIYVLSWLGREILVPDEAALKQPAVAPAGSMALSRKPRRSNRRPGSVT